MEPSLPYRVGCVLGRSFIRVVCAVWNLALTPVPHYTRWGLYPQAASLLICWGWWKFFPVIPGISVAALAFVAVIMTVRADKFSAVERVVWVFLGLGVMFAEINSLYTDRNYHEMMQRQESQRQQREFEATLHGFGLLTAGLSKTLDAVDETLKQTRPRARIQWDPASPRGNFPLPANPYEDIFTIFTFKNVGNDDATNIYELGKFSLGPPNETEAARLLMPRLESEWKQRISKQRPGKILFPLAERSFTERTDHFTGEELQNREHNDWRYYTFFRVQFTDHTGTYESDQCLVSESPLNKPSFLGRNCIFANSPPHLMRRR